VEGDCVVVMAEMDAHSADSICCDPPYGLEFMGAEWDRLGAPDAHAQARTRRASELTDPVKGGYLRHGVNTFGVGGTAMQEWHERWLREALRVLKPGGFVAAFGGTRTSHRLVCAAEDAGFQVRDSLLWSHSPQTLAWIYGSGFPKSHNLDGRWEGWGTALKPAHEPIMLARKPLSERSVAANVGRWGTGAINIEACRVGGNGVYGGGKAATTGGHDAGRWPPNVLLSHSPDCADVCAEGCPIRALDMQSGRLPAGDGRDWSGRGEHGVGGVTYLGVKSTGRHYSDAGGASRFFPQFGWAPGEFEAGFLYTAKAGRSERERGLEAMEAQTRRRVNAGGLERDPRWAPVQRRNTHPTVKPVALCRWLCRLLTPPGGTVLDPFCGSGSMGVAALREGFGYVGIERDPAYVTIARGRIAGDAPLLNVEATS
jgi:site-specific DNA-methyltransferase (adenine-specific)